LSVATDAYRVGMRAPLSWLREFAPIDGEVAELASVLSQLGLVVEGVHRVGEGLDQVVVARVLSTSPHPKADRVQLVDVDPGDGSTLRVVCGAYNFGPGDLVPLARPGTRLPGGIEIGRRKVRGQWSDGMLCSGVELHLSDDHSGILVLSSAALPGAPLTEALGVTAEVVFDLDITPNRPDALSMAGVARDLAARLGVPFTLPEVPALPTGEPAKATVVVEADDLCPRFIAAQLERIVVGPSPAWMGTRLTLAGMRPINNVVDISNYVMLEMGQPNHPYDLDRLRGGGLSVRRGREGEVVVTLDEVERHVGPDDCLICDAEGAAVGIGGIMGGASSEISEVTTTVLLEAAWFAPMAIARTSKRLGLRTEASGRFERGVDPEATDRAVARFCQLAAEVAGAGVAGATVDVSAELPRPARLVVRTSQVNALLGTSLSPADVSGYLQPIGFACAPTGDGDFRVDVPSWRPDSEREIDVVEEVARHHGYANIARTMPAIRRAGGLTPYQRDRRVVREILVGAGLSEAWATSFLAPDDLVRAGLPPAAGEVENPLAAEESILRPSLLPGLLRAVAVNAGHRHPDVALFEIGHVFLPPATEPGQGEQLPVEPEHLAVALATSEAPDAVQVWKALVDGLRLDGARLEAAAAPGLHPTRSARAVMGGVSVGFVGEVDPDALAAPRRADAYRPVSRYPSADIDLAFAVDEGTPAADVERTLARAGGDLLERLELFDVFRGPRLEGARSLAWRLRFSALDHTLTEDELTAVRLRCIDAVTTKHPARLRT